MLNQVLERDRAVLEELRGRGRAELYERYTLASERWDHLSMRDGADSDESGLAFAEARRQAHDDLEAAIVAIREVPGYERFLQPLAFEDVSSAARDTQLVYVLATKVGGLALILSSRGRGSIASVPLPRLTELSLLEQLQGTGERATYLIAYSVWRNDPDSSEAALHWCEALEATTKWLWSAVMERIIAAVNPDEPVTLIPCGWLGLLPLHAAWTEDPATPTRRRYALDLVNLRFAPNARALLAGRTIAEQMSADSLLVIDEPQPVSSSPLPNARYEAEMAAASFQEVTPLLREQAKRDDVLRLMSTCSVAHFACHGSAAFDEPLESALFMANDEPLTVRDVLELGLRGARLAVLSACEAGAPGPKLPDEFVGLPAGLFHAGFAGVIAPLWSVADHSTAMLMVRFYAYWRGGRLQPAEALRQAQCWLRETTNADKIAYFETFKASGSREAGAAGKIPIGVANTFCEALRMKPPGQRDYEHPYFWAGFGYMGI